MRFTLGLALMFTVACGGKGPSVSTLSANTPVARFIEAGGVNLRLSTAQLEGHFTLYQPFITLVDGQFEYRTWQVPAECSAYDPDRNGWLINFDPVNDLAFAKNGTIYNGVPGPQDQSPYEFDGTTYTLPDLGQIHVLEAPVGFAEYFNIFDGRAYIVNYPGTNCFAALVDNHNW